MRARRLGMVFVTVATVFQPPVGTAGENAPLARVNGTVITGRMVQEVVRSVIAGESGLPSSERIEEVTKAALESLVDLELLYQEARARNIRVSEEEVNTEIARSRAQFASASGFASALERRGLSEAQLRRDTRKTLLTTRLLTDLVWKDIHIAPDAARAWYDTNTEEFTSTELVRIRRLVIHAGRYLPEVRRVAARSKAEAIRARVLAGADFARLVREHSTDFEAALRGGDMGFIDRGTLPPAIEAIAFSLSVGELSDVIESPAGYEIIQVTARGPANVVAYDDVKEGIIRALMEEERRKRRSAFVARLRQRATIEMLGSYGAVPKAAADSSR